MTKRPDYGLDSPAIVVGELALGIAGLAIAVILRLLLRTTNLLWVISLVVGLFFLVNALGMVSYSRWGKRRICGRALRLVHWRGTEQVLDIGCGRGLFLIGAAQHLTSGKAVGVDRWIRGAVSGNRPEAALRNAALAGVSDRVEVRDGDARDLPFDDEAFDVALSNFVILATPALP
ncbi:MAG TPA: class I SAM-dependent methyltransferase [Ktedonobacterales bacterium]